MLSSRILNFAKTVTNLSQQKSYSLLFLLTNIKDKATFKKILICESALDFDGLLFPTNKKSNCNLIFIAYALNS